MHSILTRRSLIAGMSATLAVPVMAHAATRLRVVATTGMIADAARAIAGEAADVTALMGPGVDPHSYRQTRSDIVALSRADLILRNGLYLEAQMEGLFDDLKRHSTVVAVGEAVPQDALLSHPGYEDRFDPHVWMVPDLWRHAVLATRDALSAAAPDQADSFAANARSYLADLDRVSAYARDVLNRVPQQSRILVTGHDAFSYFGRAYGYEVEGIQGISTESEAGLQRIGDLVDVLVARKIGAVFVESSVSDRNMRALIEGAASRGQTVRIGGELFSDAMGRPGTYEGTYIGMIDHNATTIAAALGHDVPARGMDGKLSAGL